MTSHHPRQSPATSSRPDVEPILSLLRDGAVEGDETREALRRLAERAAASADPALARDVAVLASALAGNAEALRRHRQEREHVDERLRRSHAAIMRLARSENLSRGALDHALREITETAAEILDVERSSVWVYDDDQTAILCLELHERSKGSHQSGVELRASAFPGYFEALRAERVIAAHDAHTDPRTREFSETYLEPLGIRSMLDAPIRVGGRMIGVICNEHVGPARLWTVEEEQFACSLADFIALATESHRRRATETELRRALQEYENAAARQHTS